MEWARKVHSAAKTGTASAVVSDEAMLKKSPALFWFLTSAVYPDGEVRQPASLLVFSEDGAWKLCLNDRDNGRSLWVTAGTFSDGLQSLEKKARDPESDWRVNWAGKRKDRRSGAK